MIYLKPLVSVIITTYNSELYIRKCLNSVLTQNYTNLEIIIVDDNSQDNTVSIIENTIDSRIQLYNNKENKGPAYSRNLAINKCSGTWISILDSDDWIDPERILEFIKIQNENEVDVILDNMHFIHDGSKIPFSNKFKDVNLNINTPIKEIYLDEFLKFDLAILQPFFKSSFIKANKILYPEEIRYSEDFIFMMECFKYEARVILTSKPLYFYRIRKGSLTSTKSENIQKIIEINKFYTTQFKSQEIVNLFNVRIKKLTDKYSLQILKEEFEKNNIVLKLLNKNFYRYNINILFKKIKYLLKRG